MFKHFQKHYLAVSVAFLGLSLPAFATDTPAQNFQVQVTVLPTCRLATTTATTDASGSSDINFGNQDADATNLLKSNNGGTSAAIKVTCSKTTPYVIKLMPLNNNADGQGEMTHTTASDKITYQLRKSANMTGDVWGNTGTPSLAGNSVAGTGTGVDEQIQVHATIAAIGGVMPGVYKDTVTVVVTY